MERRFAIVAVATIACSRRRLGAIWRLRRRVRRVPSGLRHHATRSHTQIGKHGTGPSLADSWDGVKAGGNGESENANSERSKGSGKSSGTMIAHRTGH